MSRVFVDANVVFSAAYNPVRRIALLWKLPGIEIVTSDYAAAEALRNIRRKYPARMTMVRRFLKRTRIVTTPAVGQFACPIELPAKDRPIFAAAVASGAAYLLSGDEDFAPYFGRVIGGVLVMRPGDYLNLRRR